MNIAFYTTMECCPEIGGTERTTSIVADALKNIYGHRIYSIYNTPVRHEARRYEFEKTLCINSIRESSRELIAFIKENGIDIIINQGNIYPGNALADLIRKENLNCHQIFALHFAPGAFETIEFKTCLEDLKKKKSSKNLIKVLGYPLVKAFIDRKYKLLYRSLYAKASKVVLLSDKYIAEWCEYSGIKIDTAGKNNFTAIPNALTFETFATKEDIERKEKRILIVARLDERQKRLSKAISIWRDIANHPAMKDWQLDIVGEGRDEGKYHSMVEENHIPRVNFHGCQNPKAFYERSSIFLMTSQFEGFSMTLLEASQHGVIPIAFNTYLALTDIVKDGETGYAIEPDNYEEFESRIIDLVSDPHLREEIAENAVGNSRRYTIEKIAEKWQNLIMELSEGKQ